MGKDSFLIRKNLRDIVSDFDDQELGQLFRAILDYQNDRIEPSGSQKSQWLIVFKMQKNQFAIDDIAYQKICERNQKNGSGNAKKWNPVGAKKASGSQKHPVGADNDYDINTNILVLHPLQEWLKKECPRVCKMKEPITYAEAERIVSEFKDKKNIEQLFMAMENKATLLKDYVSANKTFRQWMNRNNSTAPKSNSRALPPGMA